MFRVGFVDLCGLILVPVPTVLNVRLQVSDVTHVSLASLTWPGVGGEGGRGGI